MGTLRGCPVWVLDSQPGLVPADQVPDVQRVLDAVQVRVQRCFCPQFPYSLPYPLIVDGFGRKRAVQAFRVHHTYCHPYVYSYPLE